MIAPERIRAYQFLRQTGKEFCGKLLQVIPRDVLVSTAQELGLWKSGVLVGDEGDTDILADRMIYDRILLATRILFADGFNMTSGVIFPFSPDREAAIMKYLREKEFGYRKKRLDLPENYSLYFYRLHRRFGIEVRYGADDEE